MSLRKSSEKDNAAYDETGVVTNFLFIPAGDWELCDKLGFHDYYAALPGRTKAYLVDVRQDGQTHDGLREK
jgi:hypothetical protein